MPRQGRQLLFGCLIAMAVSWLWLSAIAWTAFWLVLAAPGAPFLDVTAILLIIGPPAVFLGLAFLHRPRSWLE